MLNFKYILEVNPIGFDDELEEELTEKRRKQIKIHRIMALVSVGIERGK